METSTKEKKRITWIDMAKGYGMILVIIAHCDVGILEKWIYSFHMPLFFLLSGYVFSMKEDFPVFLKKKIRSMLVPYLGLGIPMVLYDVLTHCITGEYTYGDCIGLVLQFVIQQRLWTLWFLACLFFLNLLFYLTVRVLKTDRKLLYFAIGSTLLGWIYYLFGGHPLPWNIDVCFMAYPFFFAGYYYKKKHESIDRFLDDRKHTSLLFWILLAVNFVFLLLTFRIGGCGLEMFWCEYGFLPFTYVAAFAGVTCVIILAKRSYFRSIQYIGRNSLLYFAWHQTIMIPVAIRCLSMLHISIDSMHSIGFIILYKILQVLIILGICTICNFLISRTRLKFILGK